MIGLALKAVVGNSRRSLHIVLSVGLSVLIVFSSFSVSRGFLVAVESLSEGYVYSDLYLLRGRGMPISESAVDEGLASFFSDEVCSSVVLVEAEAIVGDSKHVMEVWGVDLESFMEVRRPWISAPVGEESFELLVGESLAARLGVNEGNIVVLATHEEEVSLVVGGVFRTETPYDEGFLVSLKKARILRPEMRGLVSLFEVRIVDESLPERVSEALGDDYYFRMEKAAAAYLGILAGDIGRNFRVLSVLVSGLALFSVIRTLVALIKESEREFRVLRALGLTRGRLRMLVVFASVLLSALGGFLGVAVGAVASNGVSIAIYVLFKLNYVAPVFERVVLAGSIVLAVSLGLVGGLITALWGGLEGRIGVD